MDLLAQTPDVRETLDETIAKHGGAQECTAGWRPAFMKFFAKHDDWKIQPTELIVFHTLNARYMKMIAKELVRGKLRLLEEEQGRRVGTLTWNDEYFMLIER